MTAVRVLYPVGASIMTRDRVLYSNGVSTVTADKVRNAIDYVKYGMNPADGEFPVYMTDETFEKWYFQNTAMSGALRDYMCACTLGIASDAAKAATSPQLKAMIERAYMLKENDISEDEKYLTA